MDFLEYVAGYTFADCTFAAESDQDGSLVYGLVVVHIFDYAFVAVLVLPKFELACSEPVVIALCYTGTAEFERCE